MWLGRRGPKGFGNHEGQGIRIAAEENGSPETEEDNRIEEIMPEARHDIETL
jgi:hypothetical protein